MKIVIKKYVNDPSSRINTDEFCKQAHIVFETTVKPQIEIAKLKGMNLDIDQNRTNSK